MDKEITYAEFDARVSQLWNTERHMYGSMQYPAREALEEFEKQGITNAKEMYELYKHRKGAMFSYAGD